MFFGKDMTIKFHEKTVVESSSLKVEDGEAAVFIGSNGAGKTTTLRGLVGFVPLSSGISSLSGTDRRAKLGISLGPEYLPENVSAKKYLKLTGDKELRNRDRVVDLYSRSGLPEIGNKKIKNLSTGMKQKISIISALRFSPQNIILDEPHNGLDPQSIEWLNSEIFNLKSSGASILISSHLLKEVSQIGDKAYKIESGKISPTQWPIKHKHDKYIVSTDDLHRLTEILSNEKIEFEVLKRGQLLINLPSKDIFKIINERDVKISDFEVG